jgi:peptidoglycan-N-acetylmuramic acid deacetylase
VSDGATVALTFDAEHPDRPACRPGNAERVLDALADARVRATFFVQGRWVEAYPDAARRIAADGHLIGNHSHHHARLSLLHDDGIRADVGMARSAIIEATGADPRPWFRAPFGDGHDDPRVLGVLDALGYRNVHWDLAVDDWEPWRTGQDVAADVIRGIAGEGACVPLLHTWPDATADAIGEILLQLERAEARFVTVDELDGALP